jgi:hypothetical protein
MNAGQKHKKPDISFAGDVRGQILSWASAASGTLNPVEFQFRPLMLGIKKYAWVIFAILLAAGIMEFNYYQARLTREYLRALLVGAAQTNGEIDALDAKLNQLTIKLEALNAKLDSIGAKIDKLPLASATQARPRPSIFSRPR